MVRVALDCYRVLGVPAQTAVEQIHPVLAQRLQSAVRPDYSPLATAARRRVIEQAYRIILEASTAGDQSGENTEMPVAPVVWVEGEELPGALALWLEWGEYEQILKTGQAACQNGIPPSIYGDTVLTMVLAYLELGREQWQRQNYQRAGVYLEQGLALLQRTGGLFPHLLQELQVDLARLRPYRILELVALPLEDEPGRRAGLALLQQMLDERGGIEGTGDAAAGLGVEEGIRFLQQLRPYMTLAEQYEYFGREARRPSAVGAYLAAQAALGLGVVQHQPQRIQEAENWLRFLHRTQPVPLELAVTTLLLGQTETALTFWEQYIAGGNVEPPVQEVRRAAPDELVALYRYAQRWLHREILPFARGVTAAALAIQRYFDDPQVTAVLECWQTPATTAPPPTPSLASSPFRSRPRSRQSPWLVTSGVVAVTTAVGLVWWLRASQPPRLLITLEQPPVPIPTPHPRPTPPTVDLRAAALETLTTWQRIKAQALGAQRAIDQLGHILMDPALSQWRQRAQQLQAEGIVETHTLKRLEIEHLQMGKPKEMVVEARIEDQVQVQGQDMGRSTYRARYELVKGDSGWRIRRISLLR
ncbi:MAG: ARC6/PARC6 family protein [Gloeomargarita sp. HHBFW_bins_205]